MENVSDVVALTSDMQSTIDAFERAWKSGRTPQLQDYLGDTATSSPALQRMATLELVMLDTWHRWRKAKELRRADACEGPLSAAADGPADVLPERPLLEDYQRRFPQIGPMSEIPLEAILEEFRARLRWGCDVNDAEYVTRFPQFARELPSCLSKVRSEVASVADEPDPPTADFDLQNTQASRLQRAGGAIPSSIGRYPVLAALDGGGQARVFRAVHPELARELVVKLGRTPIEPGQLHCDQLLAESRILAELDDPAIAHVFDAGTHEGFPFVAMEYVRGLNLRQYYSQNQPDARQAARIVAACARGLAKAHAMGITHQDLKPKNILIDENGQPRILDFGLARFRNAWSDDSACEGSVSGTPEYMSPEQAAGQLSLVGPRSDVFSLGCVLYFLLVGKPPFHGRDVMTTLAKARGCEFDARALDKRHIPRALARICRRAMQADVTNRYPSAAALAAALERFVDRPRRLRRWAIGLCSAFAVCLFVSAAVFAWTRRGPASGLAQPAGGSRVPEGDNAVARRVLGRNLRREFAIDWEVLEKESASAGRVEFKVGQRLIFRITADRDCYLSIWHIDSQGSATKLFPSEYESDARVSGGTPRTIPGDRKYAVRATASSGDEYLCIVASTDAEQAQLSQLTHGTGDRSRGVVVVADTSSVTSESMLLLHVLPEPRH